MYSHPYKNLADYVNLYIQVRGVLTRNTSVSENSHSLKGGNTEITILKHKQLPYTGKLWRDETLVNGLT